VEAEAQAVSPGRAGVGCPYQKAYTHEFIEVFVTVE
jgi:hypothetical protein